MAHVPPFVAIWKASIKETAIRKKINKSCLSEIEKLCLHSSAGCSLWPWGPQSGVSCISFYGCVLSVNAHLCVHGEMRLWSNQRSGFTNEPGPWRDIKHTPSLLACIVLIYWYPWVLNRVPFITEQKATAPPLCPFRTRRVSGSHPQAADLRQNSIKQTKNTSKYNIYR